MSDILQAQNGFKQPDQQNQESSGNVLSSFQSGLKFADLLRNAGILGGSGTGAGAGAAASTVATVPPVV